MIFTDQLNRQITLEHPPQRIISLVPSQTELLYSLGLDHEVVGITKFCVHPSAWFRKKTQIGGTKHIHRDRIAALSPDLIIANKEENLATDVEPLMADYPVWVSNIQTLQDAYDMITGIGAVTHCSSTAATLVTQIKAGFASLPVRPVPIPTAYLIWRDPWMVAGGDTFIHEMLNACGLHNVFGEQLRYPSITAEQLSGSGCELLLLSSEPYPFKEKHMAELQAIVPHARIELVDGEMFSWYGSRLLESAAYFSSLNF